VILGLAAKNSGGGNGKTDWAAKDKEIRRAVALKAAIELVSATLKVGSSLENAADAAVALAPTFEPYLRDGVDISALMAGSTEDAPNADDSDAPDEDIPF
jgi:hypothetical protein